MCFPQAPRCLWVGVSGGPCAAVGQPKHIIELHQSLVFLLTQMPLQSCSPFFSAVAEAAPGPRRTNRQCRTGCAGQLCSPSPAPALGMPRAAPSSPFPCFLPLIPKAAFPKFHPTKGDFKLDRVSIQTCFSQSLILLLCLRTDLLHIGCDTSVIINPALFLGHCVQSKGG